MLKFENVTKGYGSRRALFNVSLEFEEGRVYALAGPNGSGKSTLLKTAAGLVKPSSGKVSYAGKEIGRYTKGKIAYMSTEPFFYEYMDIKKVGGFFKDFFEDFSPEKYAELINFMGLSMDMKIKGLSSGMAAKLKIAATLSRKAEVIMLDEPLNGIDLIGRDQIIKAIIDYTDDKRTIIISSHLLDELEAIVDSVVMLKDGEVILEGSAEELREMHGKSITDMYRIIFAMPTTAPQNT